MKRSNFIRAVIDKALLSCFVVGCLTACEKELKPVSVILVDPIRHYYPVIQGEMMNLSYGAVKLRHQSAIAKLRAAFR